jgi:serine/threonine protein kinase
MACGPSSDDIATAVDYVALAPDRMVGRYRILGVLGQGGFGITYLARDSQLGRDVAIKEYLPVGLAVRRDGTMVLPRSTAAAEDFAWGRQRFIDEGRTLANLHEAPSIVKVFDFLEENGTAYMVMELLRGETLERRVRHSGRVTPTEIDAILWPLLSGLEKVHEAGFLHRDIKPANILLGDEDRPTLIDFGASRAAVADRTSTMTAVFTPGYAAPEQFSSTNQGPWTDIYGLAATLYFAVTGAPPPNAIDRMMDDLLQPLERGGRAGFAPGLLAAIDAGLTLSARERPQSIAAWRAMLAHGTADNEATLVMRRQSASPRQAPSAKSARREAPPAKPAPRRRRSIGFAGIVAIVFLVWGANHLLRSKSPRSTAATAPTVAAAADQAAAAEERRAAAAALEEKQRQAEEARKVAADKAAAEAARKRLDDEARQKAAQAEAARRIEERRKAEEAEAKARATGAVPPATEAAPASAVPPAPSTAASSPTGPWNGVYAGSLSVSSASGSQAGLRPLSADLQAAGGQLTGQLIHPTCGPMDIALTIAPSGAISGTAWVYEAVGCSRNGASVSGKMSTNALTLEIRGISMSARGTLPRRAD